MVAKSRQNRYNVLINARQESTNTQIIFLEGTSGEVYLTTRKYLKKLYVQTTKLIIVIMDKNVDFAVVSLQKKE